MLGNGKNFWKELRSLGLISKASDTLHGFMPEELNQLFSNIAISSTENPVQSLNTILSAPIEGFRLSEASELDVVLAVSHFRSQTKGEDGIPQSFVAKALPTIAPHLTKLFNASLSQEIFPSRRHEKN